jgi:integrase
MKVQRVQLAEGRVSWLVLDDAYLPIPPVLAFLKFLDDVGRSPNTIRTMAYHLKLFWDFLQDEHLDWTQIDLQHLAAFIPWLRRPQHRSAPAEAEGGRTAATIDQILTAVHAFYDFHARLKTGPALALYQFLRWPQPRYKSFLYGLAPSKPVRTRIVKLHREQRLPKVLRHEQVQRLIAACHQVRDQFLLTLLSETGLRIGQALGLRHEDLKPEDNELTIVPREDNTNGARAKRRTPYTIPVSPLVMQRYTDYLVTDLQALEGNPLPDYVFVNLWEGQIGRPMTYATVVALFARLEQQTGIHATPHMFRHTRATAWWRDEQLPLATIARLLGHASIQTTHDLYVHLTAGDLKQALVATRKRRSDEQQP